MSFQDKTHTVESSCIGAGYFCADEVTIAETSAIEVTQVTVQSKEDKSNE